MLDLWGDPLGTPRSPFGHPGEQTKTVTFIGARYELFVLRLYRNNPYTFWEPYKVPYPHTWDAPATPGKLVLESMVAVISGIYLWWLYLFRPFSGFIIQVAWITVLEMDPWGPWMTNNSCPAPFTSHSLWLFQVLVCSPGCPKGDLGVPQESPQRSSINIS